MARKIKVTSKSIKTKNGYSNFDTVSKMPKGWSVIDGALTAPKGYTWVSNGKSFFGGERQSAIIKTSQLGLSNG